MMPVHDGDRLKVVLFARDPPERRHQVIVIACRINFHIDDKG